MLPLGILALALVCAACQRAAEGPSAWALQTLPADQGPIAHRIVPARPWWDLDALPENWAELRSRPDGVRLVLLSSAKRYLAPKITAHEDPFLVDVSQEPQRQYRAVRLAGGQNWLCSPAMTRYIVEQLRSGRSAVISRPWGEIFCELHAGGFRACWDDLTSQGFGLEPAALLPLAAQAQTL